MKSGVYEINFKTGTLERVRPPVNLLPVGQIVTYWDQANPLREYAVTEATVRDYDTGQRCVCEDGHAASVHNPGTDGHAGFQLGNRVLDAEELAAFLASAAARMEASKAAANASAIAKTEAKARRRADYLAQFPWLEQVKPGGYASAALGSKNLKRELARAFLGVKFSVKSNTYSGGDSIDVHWTLGPTTAEVKAVADKYQEGDFDGMDDSYNYRGNVWPELFGGAKYVHTNRGEGDAFNVVAAGLCRLFGLELPADGRSFWNIRRENDRDDVGVLARQILVARSYPVGAVVSGVKRAESAEAKASGRMADFYQVTLA